MSSDLLESESASLITTLRQLSGGYCFDCAQPFNDEEALFSIAMGFKNAPRCFPCLANGLDREPAELRQHLLEYIRRRDCYRQAWEMICRHDHQQAPMASACRATTSNPEMPNPRQASEWDAGDMSCGDLVLALRIRLNSMSPGNILKITAHDPAAPEDLPSWCRLTGHTLLKVQHPEYYIRRKEI